MGERTSPGSCCRCFKLNSHLRGHILAYLDQFSFFFFSCVHACVFVSMWPMCACMDYVCIMRFSALLAVPVYSSVQVAHDPGSAGRYMSFMSSAPFSNLGQRMIEWTRSAMTHTQWHAQVTLKNDFFFFLSGSKVALWKTAIDLKFTMEEWTLSHMWILSPLTVNDS